MVYEELIHSCEQTAIQLLDALGISRPQTITFGQRKMKQQADHLTEE